MSGLDSRLPILQGLETEIASYGAGHCGVRSSRPMGHKPEFCGVPDPVQREEAAGVTSPGLIPAMSSLTVSRVALVTPLCGEERGRRWGAQAWLQETSNFLSLKGEQ